MTSTEKKQDYYFTFGSGHSYPNHYVKFFGTYSETRDKMVNRYGIRWCGQYAKEDIGIERLGLKELKV